MNCKKKLDLSESDIRSHYLDKLNFAGDLLMDLLSEKEEIKKRMESLHSELEELIQSLTKAGNGTQGLSEIRELIKNGDEVLKFIYFATEDEIYLKIKNRFDLNPNYSWEVCDKVYNKLHNVSQKIEYLSEITSKDISDIQKSLMQIAIIFNTNLNEELGEDKYLIRHLNAVYHYVRGDFNESLYQKVDKEETEWNVLQKAKNEYQRALEFDKNLSKAKRRLAEIEKMIV